MQQLQAHLIRSASTSPFLSPQNSLQLLHSSAAAAAAVSAAAALHTPSPYFPFINPGVDGGSKSDQSLKEKPEQCSNVVSSTMEDEDSSSREGLTPLTTVKVFFQDFWASFFDLYLLRSRMPKGLNPSS